MERVKADNDKYQLEVLTVATQLGDLDLDSVFDGKIRPCQIGEYVGCAGHVLVTYPSGGKILTSCGHWIELVKLDTNMESLLLVAKQEYGEKMYSALQSEYMSAMNEQERSNIRQKYAQRMIQSSAPSKKSSIIYRKKDK